ncbi:MAG: 3-oxoacyl-ACP synthase [Myxococcales bacterium]|nr:3-oxoacyl-ACP synthase [Myxococcales bacterium]
MGACIEAAVTTTHRGVVFGRGAVRLSDAAATACLDRAHHRADELDLLINAGIYKDRNTAEPALAAIIQENIGANAEGPPRLGHHGTFSFDVANGGCGVLTAAQLLDGFVGHGAARLGMIVAADADPSPRTSRGFAFGAAGGAVLLSGGLPERGFQRFVVRTFPQYAGLFDAQLRWDPHAGFAHLRGRNVVEIKEAPEFAARSLECAELVARDLVEGSIAFDQVDLLITSQYPPGFGVQLAQRLGIPAARVPVVRPELALAHTAGPIASLEAAIEAGSFARADHVLFVTVGAGVTVAAALYRAEPTRG